MARIKVPLVVINSSTGLPVSGASVTIANRSSGTAATWYSTETGGTGSTSAVATDASGRIAAWVDRGAYSATISGTGITTYTEAFDAAAATDSSVDQAWVDTGVLLPGEVKMFAGLTAPAGWLTCDGTPVSRTTYSRLFSAIGTAYGTGDGATTFNLPDFRGRSPLGSGTGSGLSTRTRGQTGGEETHLLTLAEAPAHSHLVNTQVGNTGSGQGIAAFTAGTGTTQYAGSTTDTRGGGAAHNVMHPFSVVNFIIKT